MAAMSNGPYQQALRLMTQRVPDKARALSLLREAVAGGNPAAHYALGTWYLFGESGLRRNAKTARKYIAFAAENGVASALFDLAVMYEKGEGGSVDLVAAYRSYVEAALRGDAQAVFEVARCLHYAIGCERDLPMSALWAGRARELGVYEASQLES